MKEKKKLRNTLRGYYDNQEEPFSDMDWERASAYLDAEKRKRRIRGPVIILAALVAGFLVVLLSLPGTGPEKQIVSQKHEVASSPALPVFRAAAAPEAASIPDAELSLTSGPSSPDLSPARRMDRPAPKQQAASSAARSLPLVEPGMAEKETVTATPVNTAEKMPPIAPAFEGPVSPGTAIATANNQPQNDGEQNVQETRKEQESTDPVRPESPALPPPPAPATEISNSPAAPLPQAADLALNIDKQKAGATDSVKPVIPNSAAPAAVSNISPSSILPAVAENTLPDSLLAMDPLAGEGIFYEAGAAWLYGWKGAAKTDARGFSPLAGINYMNRLSRRCALSFGAQYLRVGNLSNSSKTSRVSSYVYGEQSRMTVITPSTLHYLVAPLRIHYYMNQKNSMGVGLNLAYLLNVEATVTSYDERAGFAGNYETTKLAGYTEGFSWYDSQLAFFYNRKIGHSLGIQAEVFLGLTDVKQDAFFAYRHKERNSGARLSLVYYAFRKNRK